MDPHLFDTLRGIAQGQGRIVFLTGAGISAESGIPTFRGSDGYWTIGSRVYQPQELATWSMFSRHPEMVWPWYLYRRTICRQAEPNPAHRALVDIEHTLNNRFVLVTQNVDGLHLRAGSTAERTWEIHGNIDYMRCAGGCRTDWWPVPDLGPVTKGMDFDASWRESLSCPDCGGWSRPHVLWFDESYDEERYRFESGMKAAMEAELLVVVGTSGATTLPARMGEIAHMRGIAIVDVNPEPNPFSRVAMDSPGGWIRATACEGLAPLSDALAGGRS